MSPSHFMQHLQSVPLFPTQHQISWFRIRPVCRSSTGHFYFAETGHSHFAATKSRLTMLRTSRAGVQWCRFRAQEGKTMLTSRRFAFEAHADHNADHEIQRMKLVREFLLFAALLCLAGALPLFAQTSPLLPSQKAPLSER